MTFYGLAINVRKIRRLIKKGEAIVCFLITELISY